MGSATKTTSNVKNSSISEQSIMSETNDHRNNKANKSLTGNKNFLEAFDSPVPLVVPPHDSRTLNVRNCGTSDCELTISIQNTEANDIDSYFEVQPEHVVIKQNGILQIKVTYNPSEQKFDPNTVTANKTKGKSNKISNNSNANISVSNVQKRHALLEVIIGDKECFYMYPILGSSDPDDEKIALQKHIELNKDIADSDEENERSDEGGEGDSNEIRNTSKRRSIEQIEIEQNRRKKRKLSAERILPDMEYDSEIKIKEECPDDIEDTNIEIKEEPIDLP